MLICVRRKGLLFSSYCHKIILIKIIFLPAGKHLINSYHCNSFYMLSMFIFAIYPTSFFRHKHVNQVYQHKLKQQHDYLGLSEEIFSAMNRQYRQYLSCIRIFCSINLFSDFYLCIINIYAINNND